MLPVLLALALGQMGVGALPDPEGPIFPSGKYSYADFELAPPTGVGMTAHCACAAVTLHQGSALTWSRSSQGWCSKKGETFDGIEPGDLVVCGNDLPRVEPDAWGTPGLRVEGLRTQLLLRTEKLENGAWTRTVTATADTDTSPANGLSADTLEDTSAVSSQSATQTYVAVGNSDYTGSLFVKAGTLDSVRLTVSGSGGGTNTCTATGLSSTTYKRVTCTVNATTNITLAVLPGDDAADMGTIKVWGAMLETGVKATSYIQADSITVVRQADGDTTAAALPMVPSCWAASVTGLASGGNKQITVGINANYVRMWSNASGNAEADRATPTIAATDGAAPATGRYVAKYVTNGASATVQICTDGTCGSVTTSNSTTPATATDSRFGYNSALGYHIDGIISRIRVDDNPENCL